MVPLTVMLAVIVAVLPEPLLSVSVKVLALAAAFWAIVTLVGPVLEPWPLVLSVTVMLLPWCC